MSKSKQQFYMTRWHCGGEQVYYGEVLVVPKSEYDALRSTLEGYPGIVHDLETLKRKYESLRRQYAKLYDDHYGTPCEQIRRQQQAEN